MINLKTPSEIEIMKVGGEILNEVMSKLLTTLDVGTIMSELDMLAEKEIKKRQAFPSFKMVPGYKWSICTCVNDVVVHGIPNNYKAKKGDVIGIDCGVFYNGYHTDASWTVRVGKPDKKDNIEHFLKTGEKALNNALDQVKPGNYIYDISRNIQQTVEQEGFSVVKSLIGHGIGKNLHEEPEIPCFVKGQRENTAKIVPGLCLAIEVIYNMGGHEVISGKDGWTIVTKDATISGLFETTVATANHGVILLTKKYGSPRSN